MIEIAGKKICNYTGGTCRPLVVLKDCVGSRNRELHDMALKLMEQTFFDVASAADISAIWSQR